MSEPKGFFSYWWDVLLSTLKELGWVTVVVGTGGGVAGSLLAWWCGITRRDELPELIFIVLASAVAAVVLELLIRCLFITPWKKHIEAGKTGEAKTDLERMFSSSAEDRYWESREKREFTERWLSSLEPSTGREHKDSLAAFLVKIEARIAHIRKIGPAKFVGEVVDSDKESLKLGDEIESFLKTNFGEADAVLFKSTTGIQYTEGIGQSPRPFVVDKQSSRPRDAWCSQQATIDVLTDWANKLKALIKKLD